MKSEADKMLERAQATVERNRAAGVEPDPEAWQPLGVTRIIINGVSRETHRQLQELAWRSKSSLSRLGLLALEQLLVQAQQGTLPLLPPADLDGAIEVGYMGIPTER